MKGCLALLHGRRLFGRQVDCDHCWRNWNGPPVHMLEKQEPQVRTTRTIWLGDDRILLFQ